MTKKTNLITLEVQGVGGENGHVRFDEFLKKLEDLLVTLNGIDRIVGNTFQPTLYYRVVKVTHSSPLGLRLSPWCATKSRSAAPRSRFVIGTTGFSESCARSARGNQCLLT